MYRITADSSARASILFKAVSDPTRLQILYLVADAPEQGLCSLELSDLMGVSAPTVTHHMKKLLAAGLVSREQRGKWAYYRVVPPVFEHVHQLVSRASGPAHGWAAGLAGHQATAAPTSVGN